MITINDYKRMLIKVYDETGWLIGIHPCWTDIHYYHDYLIKAQTKYMAEE